MASLVIRDANFFVFVHHAALFFQTSGDTFNRFVEFNRTDRFLFSPSCKQRGFVDQVGQVRTDKAGCDRRDFLQVDVFV